MIVVIANNDLDLLALRAAVEALPDGFPPVRAHGGVGLGPDTPLPDLARRPGRARPPPQGQGGVGAASSTTSAPSASPPAPPSWPSAARRASTPS